MHNVLPGIGAQEKDWQAIEEKISQVRPFAQNIHIDIVDGVFAPNTTFLDPEPFKTISEDVFLELHMMVDNPENYLHAWAKAGFRRFIGHVEKMHDQAAFVAQAQELGEVGLALDLETEVSAITVPVIDLDSILIMTVKAGFAGQVFHPQALEKVRYFAKEGVTAIEVDGGITDLTLPQALQAGATRCVTTSYLFNGENPQANMRKLEQLFNESVASE